MKFNVMQCLLRANCGSIRRLFYALFLFSINLYIIIILIIIIYLF